MFIIYCCVQEFKDTIRKQITTNDYEYLLLMGCVQEFKDTIRKQITTQKGSKPLQSALCSRVQRYNQKANHNMIPVLDKYNRVVFKSSKIQLESKSQHYVDRRQKGAGCVQEFKDTIRKQITTNP